MLEILLSSSVLILVLALLRRFLQGRISARLRYALWALVLLRLLVPVTAFESKVSVASVAQPIAAQVQEYSAQRAQTVYIPVTMGERPDTGEPNTAVARVGVEPLDLARWVWYAGMAAAAGWFALVNVRMARRLKKDRVYWGSHRSVPVYIAKDIPSPCLFGLFRPAVYLTEQAAADETQAGQILAHEYSHLCHGDLFWALMRSLCLVVWWFDPFVWWAAALSRRDGELACDESAIRRLGEEQRFDYGRTLLALATVKLRPGDLLCGATTMTGGKNSLRERIEGIARTKKLSLSLAALALAVTALAVGCTFSGAESDDPGPAPAVTPAPVATGSPAASDSDSDTVLLGEGYESRTLVIADEEMVATLSSVEGALEAFTLYSTYLTDYTNESPVPWLTWLRFENKDAELMALDNYEPLTHAEILSIEKINEKLFAFTAEINTASDRPAEKILNFLVLDSDEGSYVIRHAADIPEELSENLDPARYDPQLLLGDGTDLLGEGYKSYGVILTEETHHAETHHAESHHDTLGSIAPAQTAIQATLLDYIDPAFVMIGTDENYVSDGTAFADMSFEDLLFSTDSWQVDTAPRGEVNRSASYIALFDGKGSFVIIDAERAEISFHPNSQFYAAYSIPGASGSFYYDSLLAWASALPQMGEDPEPVYMQFLTMAFTTDYRQRCTILSAAGAISPPGPEDYEAFYADLRPLVTESCYNTMLLNMEILSLDKLALERGYTITPLSFEITAVNQTRGITAAGVTDRWQHEFTALVQVTTDEGLTGTGTLTGYVLTDADSDGAQVSGFKLEGGTILNADPAEDLLPTDNPVDELKKFADPDAVVINGSGPISGGSGWPAMSLEELLASSDSWQQTLVPSGASVRSGSSITLSDGNGSFLVIDAGSSDIFYYPQNQLYAGYRIPGAEGIDYYNALLDWASGFPGPNEAP